MGRNQLKMELVFAGGKRVEARWDAMVVATDQSPAHGGSGSAPEPFMLFLASLGTCTAAYVQGFCEARAIDHTRIKMTEIIDYDETGKVTSITVQIHLPEDFPEKYIRTIERVANGCAVKKAIMSPPQITIRATKD